MKLRHEKSRACSVLFACLLVCELSAPGLAIAGGFSCATVFRTIAEKVGLLHPWSGFQPSDPRDFQAGSPFHFLVHAVTTRKGLYGVDLIRNPERIAEVPVLSTSLISESKTVTYGNSGLILDIPFQRIFISTSQDAAILNEGGYETLRPYRGLYGVLSPTDLLKQTSKNRYNEVVVLGNLEEAKSYPESRVVGYFVKVDENQRPLCSPERYEELKQLSEEKNLPLIPVIEHDQVPPGDDPRDILK